MSNKKQFIFHNSIQGKFIPRSSSPTGSAFYSGASSNRSNAKMAELFACSSIIDCDDNDEMENSSRVFLAPNHYFQTSTNETETTKNPKEDASNQFLNVFQKDNKSQPITFGQLRQAAIASNVSTTIEEKSNIDQGTYFSQYKYQQRLRSVAKDFCQDISSISSNLSIRDSTNREQLTTSTLTVDDILTMFYTSINLSTNTESHLSSAAISNSTNIFDSYLSTSQQMPFHNNLHTFSRLMLDERIQNRPSPPSYSSSILNLKKTHMATEQPAHQFISSTMIEKNSSESNTSQVLSSDNLSSNSENSTSLRGRPPPPCYQPKTSTENSLSVGFNHEFSRLLYGKGKRQKMRRKAYSDPIKNCVEEANQNNKKPVRSVTTHLNRANSIKERQNNDGDDDESEMENLRLIKQKLNLNSRRQNSTDKHRKIPTTNSSLKRRIPKFLRIYCQAPSSNDTLLQWDLFSLSELETFYSMMTRLYKNENLARIQNYEFYRTVLLSTLTSKLSPNSNMNTRNNII